MMTNEERFKKFCEVTHGNTTDKPTGVRRPLSRDDLIDRFTRELLRHPNQYSDERIAELVGEFESWLSRGDDDGDRDPGEKARPQKSDMEKRKKKRTPAAPGLG